MFEGWHDYSDETGRPPEVGGRRLRVWGSFGTGIGVFFLSAQHISRDPWLTLLVLFVGGAVASVLISSCTGLALSVLGGWVGNAGTLLFLWASNDLGPEAGFWVVLPSFVLAVLTPIGIAAGFAAATVIRRRIRP